MLHFHVEHGKQSLALSQLSVIHTNLEMLLAYKICTLVVVCILVVVLNIRLLLLHKRSNRE